MQELGILVVAGVALLGSSGAQMVAPLFFGKVVDSAQKSMGKALNTLLLVITHFIKNTVFIWNIANCYVLLKVLHPAGDITFY